MEIVRWMWISVGIASLVLATLGVILPLLPTTPLVILAAYCFSKASPALHQWLRENRYFGPLLKDWEQYGVIRKRSKMMATVAIVFLFSLSFYLTKISFFLKGFLVLIAFLILGYIWSRPSHIPATELEG